MTIGDRSEHSALAGGEFGAQADLYDRARPGYPADAVNWALPQRVVRLLDIGAGSGKLTAAITHRAEEIIAVDPSEPMLDRLVDRLRNRVPRVQTRIGTAEHTGLPAHSVDAAVAGAAFHWFRRPDADAELARVLRPGGMVALLWNPIHPDDPVQHVFQRARMDTGFGPDEFDPTLTMDLRWFGATERADFTAVLSYSVDEVVEQLASRSYLLRLDLGRRNRILGQARDRLAELAPHGHVHVRYRTTVLRAIRRHDATAGPDSTDEFGGTVSS